MLKTYRRQILLSSAVILLPMVFGVLLWDQLPPAMTTHWGTDGQADGVSRKAFAVFGLPCILLVMHFVCLLFTMLDKKQKEQSRKALSLVFWILPVISLFANGMMYRAALDRQADPASLTPAFMGLMFILIGNYFPKIKQNSTLGIKLPWTLRNEENWNKTHRLGGKVSVAGGFVLLFSLFLPLKAMVWALLLAVTAIAVIPAVYSYALYRQHRKLGIAYGLPPKSYGGKRTAKVSILLTVVILIGVAVLMFTGDIEVTCQETAFRIDATYWNDLQVDHSRIDTILYREDLDVGVRTNGFGSAKLLMGTFRNEEFGSYTLYAYTKAEGYLVLTSDEETLVIGMDDANETRALYDTMISKLEH